MGKNLSELISMLEAATTPDPGLGREVVAALVRVDDEHAGGNNVLASIDAAVALAERVLPGAGWSVAMNRIDRRYVGRIWSGEIDDGKANAGANPAIALCIAILRAAEESAG